MGRWRVYIKPFKDDGTYEDSFTEVTSDVDLGLGAINTQLDDTDFDIGVIRSGNMSLKVNNISGSYSDVGELGSIFKFTRADSQVKVTWALTDDLLQCGLFQAGDPNAIIAEEKTVFEGLLNDDAARMSLVDQFITFKVLGREDILKRASVDIASVSNGDLTSAALFAILNQTAITNLLTVSADNISVGSDQTIDDKSDLEGQTVKEAVDSFLRISNSVLYIKNNTIYVSPRTPTASVQYSFYGQASNIGVENIMSMDKITNGINRVFNFLQWGDTTTVRTDNTSLNKFGVKKRSTEFSVFTTVSKQEDMLDDILAEFKDAKQEMDLKARFDYGTQALDLLDRIDIDYPSPAFSEVSFPIVGIAVIGDPETPLPGEQFSFTIDQLTNYKITRKSINPKSDTVTYHLREI